MPHEGQPHPLEPFKLPEFPALFTEKDQERIGELERLAKEQQRAYRGLIPWKDKPALVRGLRRIAEVATPGWVAKVTPWKEKGFTPEQADVFIRETEEELLELRRREIVAGRTPSILDYITALAAEGLLTGEEAQLYELIPELNPSGSVLERLNLTEEERSWFLEYSGSLIGKPREEVYRLYAEEGFPAPKTVAELVDLVETVIPEPRQVLTTIALSKNLESITAALKERYAPKVDKDYIPALENINTELKSLGLEPTGDVKKDIKALGDARAEQVEEEGVPVQVILGNGEVINVKLKDERDVYTNEGVLIAHYNPNTEELIPAAELAVIPVLDEKERRATYDQRMLGIDEEYADISDWTAEGWQERRKADPDRFQEWQDARTVAFNEWQYGHLPLKEPLDPWEALHVFGVGITKLLPQVGAAVLQAIQSAQATRRGEAGAGASVVDKDWADRFIEDAEKNLEQFVEEVGEKFEGRIPAELAQFPRNLAFSLTSMGAGLGIGVPIALAPIPGARVWAYVAGTAASGEVAYHITKYQIVQQYLELKNEESKAELGREITLEEENKLKVEFDSLANRYGLWEAIPEAVSNLAFVGILTAPMTKMLGKYLAVRVIGKITAMYGQELLTETITQKGQSSIEIEAGLREGRISWAEAFKEIAPQTFLLTTVMGGAGTVIISTPAAIRKIKASLKAEVGGDHPMYAGLEEEALARQAEITPKVPEEVPTEVPAVPEARINALERELIATLGREISFRDDLTWKQSMSYLEQGVPNLIIGTKGATESEVRFIAYHEWAHLIASTEGLQVLTPEQSLEIGGRLAKDADAWLWAIGEFNRKGLSLTEVSLLIPEDIKVLSVMQEQLPKPPAVEVTKPPVRVKVQTEEVTYQKKRLVALEKESAVFKENYKTQSEKLEALKKAKAPAYDLVGLQESIKNLGGLLAELNTRKTGIQTKIETLTGTTPEIEVIPERVAPEIQASAWDKLPYPSKVALADKVGIAKTAAAMSWENLTSVQQEKLSGVPIQIPLPFVEVKDLTQEELTMGGAIDKTSAEEEAKNLVSLPERVLPVGEIEQSREAAAKIIDEQLYSADRSNPLSEAMVAAHHLGSIREYIRHLDSLPKTEDGNIDWDGHIASRLEGAEFNDVSSWNIGIMPTLDGFAFLDKGKFGGPLRMSVYQVGDQALLAKLNFEGGWARKVLEMEKELGLERPSWIFSGKRKAFNEMTATILENISLDDTIVPTEELIQRENIAEAVRGLTGEQQRVIVEYSKSMRRFFDEVLAEMNEVRIVLGRKPIGYLRNYLPWVYKTNIWGKLLGLHLKPDFLAEQAQAPDFIRPNTPWNPRALSRRGGLADYERIKDIRRLFLDYTGVAAKEMFYTPAINNAKAASRYLLREKGLEVPSRWVENVFQRNMVGTPDSLSRWVRETLPPQLTNLAVAIRSRLNPAVLGLNPKWNLFVQTSSLSLSILRTGGKWTALGTQYLWNPKARAWVQDNVPAYIIKERGRGSIVHQDLGTTLSEAQQISRSPLQTVDEWVTVITRRLENWLNGITAYAAKLKGESLGLKGAELVAFASDGAATTQSMYDPFHLPLAYSPFVRLVVPFQTFSFEALTRVREMSGIKFLRAGTFETVAANSIEGQGLIRNRVGHFLEFMTAIWIINMVGELFNNRKPWEWSSFMPMANIMMMGADPNNPWNLPAPVRYVNEMWKGFEALIEYGNWKPLTFWTLKWHAPAGAQAKKMLEGTIAAIDGAQKDVSGEILFEFEDDPLEYIKAVTLGIWTTDAGKEYIKTHFEDQPVTTQRIIKDLDKAEEQLGTSVEGKWYTLGDYGTVALSTIRREGIPDWQVLSDEPIYPLLAQFRLYSETAWEEYFKLPSEHRIQYRKDNPYVDASLYFWERSGTLRSEEAKEMLESLMKQFIGDNPRAHWRGLPEIPEEIKLLPE